MEDGKIRELFTTSGDIFQQYRLKKTFSSLMNSVIMAIRSYYIYWGPNIGRRVSTPVVQDKLISNQNKLIFYKVKMIEI